jgi:hypothetical protein
MSRLMLDVEANSRKAAEMLLTVGRRVVPSTRMVGTQVVIGVLHDLHVSVHTRPATKHVGGNHARAGGWGVA